jgi:hypothetical protein
MKRDTERQLGICHPDSKTTETGGNRYKGGGDEGMSEHTSTSSVRKFDTGATRDTEDGKLDYEGFFAPQVVRRFAQYMHEHRFQKDGSIRDSDNWQKGITLTAYMKSLWRHFIDVWLHHRGRSTEAEEALEDALCGILFNTMGYLFETLLKQEKCICSWGICTEIPLVGPTLSLREHPDCPIHSAQEGAK